MALSRSYQDVPRPDGAHDGPAPAPSIDRGRRIAALVRGVRDRGWTAVRDRIARGWRQLRVLETLAAAGGMRRARSRGFTPGLEGGLEGRVLLSYWHSPQKVLAIGEYHLRHPSARAAFLHNFPPQVQHAPLQWPVSGITRRRVAIATQTARGGQAVEVTALDGSHYMIKLSYTSNTLATNTAEGTNGQGGNTSSTTAASLVSQQNANYPQPIGTVRAYAMPGGRVGIIVDGSTSNTDLTINPLGQPQIPGFAKSFAYGESARNHMLNIGQITVTSGQIGAIEGFQDAVLSGPLTVNGTSAIDRIAFDAIVPGASINVGGDLQTLDVLNSIDLSGPGTGITVGRDLNLLNVGGPITLSNGAYFFIGRNIGLISQPPKGTGTGSNVLSLNYTAVANSTTTVVIPSVGAFIQGNISIDPGSYFGIGGLIYNTMYVEGSVNGFSRLYVEYGSPTQTQPQVLTSLPTFSFFQTTTPTPTPPPTQAGPAPNGYLTALQGVIP
ncbi:MAG: hypothetical protein ACYC61_13860 [Isosphaeraceae bacterium]